MKMARRQRLVPQFRHFTNLEKQSFLPPSSAEEGTGGGAPSSSSRDVVKLLESAAAVLIDPFGVAPSSLSQSGVFGLVPAMVYLCAFLVLLTLSIIAGAIGCMELDRVKALCTALVLLADQV